MQYLQPNTILQGGKYGITRVLGQGGFGITYLAEQVSLGRKVAIKEFFMRDFCSRVVFTQAVTAPTTGSSRQVEQYKRKFVKEARNLARLNHPHIISVIDVFEENGTVYYVMPYLSGGSLQDYVKARGALSEAEAIKSIKQIATALKYMHEEQHICHYDVKPANILLDDKGNAVLIDFGISKNYDASGYETTTTPVGMSEGYAPIEQYQQNVEEFSPVSDVYALGATLYFLLHGKRPVNAPSRAGGTSLLMKKSLSPQIKNIINASMKISKAERAKSMDVFLKDDYATSYANESTIVGGSRTYHRDSEETIIDKKESVRLSDNSNKSDIPKRNSTNHKIGWLVLGAVVIVNIFLILYDSSTSPNSTYKSPQAEATDSDEIVWTEAEETTAVVDENAIYSERVKKFAKSQKNVIASFPNDKRYSVYYSKKGEYNENYLYRYDAISDKTEKMPLPIEATTGGYTNLWLTKNKRYIFVSAEYRYSDFIRIDTETGQVKYITDCLLVKRTNNGFKLVQARCTNEYEAQSMADMEYAYTDYYYNEEGVCIGHGEEYTTSPY